MITQNLHIDLLQAQAHLNALAPHNGSFTFQTFADGSDKNKALIKQFNGSFEQHASQLTQLNQEGAGVYVTVNQTDLKGRKTENITAVRGVFVDFDNSRPDRLNDLLQLDRLYDGALLPSLIVETSTGKHHAYWLAEGIPLDHFKPYQQTLIYFFKSLFDGDNVDEAIHDLPRIMRLAGFYHNKGEPILTKIVYPNSGQDIQRYSYEQIKDMIDSLPAPLEQTSLLQTNSDTHTSKVILPQSPANSQTLPQLTAEKVRTLSRGRWDIIFNRLGIAVSTNPKEHTACPVCGGLDRFRFDNQNQTGSFICSQGNGQEIAGDGLSLLADHAGMGIVNAIASVTGVLNDMGLLSPYDGVNSPKASEWGELEPLEETNPTPTRYPIEAWQGVLRQTVEAIAYHAQVPLAMAGQCVLGALSTIGQRYINAPMGHEYKPACLFLITEGESGSGKTQANKYSHYSITKWEKNAYQIFVERLQEWEADRNDLKGAERTHYDANVPKPKNESMIVTDATIEAVLDRFIVDGLPNQSWTTSEAGQFLNGHSMKSDTAGNALSSLTSVWSGDPVSRLRSQRGKNAIPYTNAYDARLTLDIMGQRVILEPALNDPLMNGQGFLPRCLIACPESLIGSRQWATPERMNQSPYDDPRLLAYWARCDILLDPVPAEIQRDNTGKEIRFNMPFADQQARQTLANFQDEIEGRQAKGRALEYLRAFASRMAENASRIASLMAFFDCQKSVSVDYLQRAFMLVEYSIAERLRYLDAKPAEKTDSQKLIDWIVKQCKVKGVNRLSYADTQSKVNPKHLRAKASFELCVNVLSDKGYIRVITLDNTRYIEVNPSLLS